VHVFALFLARPAACLAASSVHSLSLSLVTHPLVLLPHPLLSNLVWMMPSYVPGVDAFQWNLKLAQAHRSSCLCDTRNRMHQFRGLMVSLKHHQPPAQFAITPMAGRRGAAWRRSRTTPSGLESNRSHELSGHPSVNIGLKSGRWPIG